MLESIVINNFTIIDRIQLEFERGMTALTGETGAGKSILLDAIQLVLGDRADSDSVSAGSEKADIAVSFDITQLDDARDWLQENGLDDAGECLLRRMIFANGRSKAFINGSPATLTQLKTLGEMLVDLHGQHEHQSLQKATVQRQLLDASMKDNALLNQVRGAYREWKSLADQLRQARDQSIQKQQRIDLLKMYCSEFEELALGDHEMTTLQEESSRLSHAGQIIETATAVMARLYDNDETNVQQLLSACQHDLEQLQKIDPSLNNTAELVKSALIQVEEAASELRSYQDDMDVDPARLDWLNQRLSQAQSLARKHQHDVQDLPAHYQSLQQELDRLQLDEADIEKLVKKLQQASDHYRHQATTLSSRRQATATDLSAQITLQMHTLGMQGGRFEIEVQSPPDAPFSASGIDQIQFLVSANPGQALKPLNKVASGGELSRISLAIQVILSTSCRIPTLIFDEVDSGIGGGIAEIVGRKLREIAAERQVFCVTHLPQVASQAHQHLQVNKTKTENQTKTDVVLLNETQRLEEIARMLGGMTITEQTRAHAREMIQNV